MINAWHNFIDYSHCFARNCCIQYDICVGVYTLVGSEPYSGAITEMTAEDRIITFIAYINFRFYSQNLNLHFFECTNLLYYTLTEPATAPQNVTATAESSTEIMVTWEEVFAIDENGIIINYEVQFEPLEFTETLTTSSVNTTNLTVLLSSIQEYVEYNISVRAYTSVGPGPYSDPVTERTLEDRKFLCIF